MKGDILRSLGLAAEDSIWHGDVIVHVEVEAAAKALWKADRAAADVGRARTLRVSRPATPQTARAATACTKTPPVFPCDSWSTERAESRARGCHKRGRRAARVSARKVVRKLSATALFPAVPLPPSCPSASFRSTARASSFRAATAGSLSGPSSTSRPYRHPPTPWKTLMSELAFALVTSARTSHASEPTTGPTTSRCSARLR